MPAIRPCLRCSPALLACDASLVSRKQDSFDRRIGSVFLIERFHEFLSDFKAVLFIVGVYRRDLRGSVVHATVEVNNADVRVCRKLDARHRRRRVYAIKENQVDTHRNECLHIFGLFRDIVFRIEDHAFPSGFLRQFLNIIGKRLIIGSVHRPDRKTYLELSVRRFCGSRFRRL